MNGLLFFRDRDVVIQYKLYENKEKLEMLNLNSRYHTQEPDEYYLHTINEDHDLSRVTSKSDKIVDIFSSSTKKRKSDLDFNNQNYADGNENNTPK